MSIWVNVEIEVDTGGTEPRNLELWSGNITGNLRSIARACGVEDVMWNRDGYVAGEAIGVLESGIEDLEIRQEKYDAMNPKNGWGSREGLADFLRKLLAACIDNPKAKIRGSW